MKIAIDSLSSDALEALIESFVLREGTEYDQQDHSLASKCADVRRQLHSGEAEIFFDPQTETVDIRPSSAN